MQVSFKEMLTSRIFKFIIGPDEVPMVVHETVLAEQSPALAALMRGGMAESVAGECRWMDVDQGTFARLAQFAYTGDYSIPNGSTGQAVVEAKSSPAPALRTLHRSPHSITSLPSPGPELSAFYYLTHKPKEEWEGHGHIFSSKDGKKSKNGPLSPFRPALTPAFVMFSCLKYPLSQSRSSRCTCEPPMDDGPVENSGEVLLAHASLYVLAEKWGVNDLNMLALSKLHRTLSTLSLDKSGVQEVINLTRYTYSDGVTPDLETGMDGLRNLICLYIAANVGVVSEQDSFTDLIEDGGAFVRDIWKLVVPRGPS
ncbi:hypothetical protein BJ875DRAFT_477644 [Amylocarpus encephaloides]|uniref:BTB domain-containing protein n=1 Tax=Amylocarpus encephaloides TaxID=45428 RepID=A0A9P8C0P9_9HELO|nr:hypothetical protein BJ875DRAFT_477644 [Amylocarpus encephaloides]